MERLFKSRIKYIYILVVAISLLFTSSSIAATGSSKKTAPTANPDLLHCAAYYVITSSDETTSAEDMYSEELQQKLSSLSRKDIDDLMRAQISSIIKKKEQGDTSILWDEAFVEGTLKTKMPDLYTAAVKQVIKDKKAAKATESPFVAASITPGSKTRTFSVYCYHWTGYTMWGFFSRIYWTWDSSKITYVSTSTYGEVYDPSWFYAGIISDSQYYTSSSHTTFYKWVKGKFGWPSIGPLQGYDYPWLSIYVHAGGNSSYTSGIS